jgi:hypothetical protein
MRPPAFALLALLAAAACGGKGECCAFPNDVNAVAVDEEGRPVPGARVEFAPAGMEPARANWSDTTGVANPDTRGFRTDSAGVATYYHPDNDSVSIRVSLTPPAGYALADSSRASETVLHYRVGSEVRFVLKRVQ